MDKTGESYTAARAVLLRAEAAEGVQRPPLVTSEENIIRRTGRGWEQWFDALDEWGAAERSHREIARWVAQQLGIEPRVWEAQAVTLSYERTRGLRAVGQRTDGVAISVQKTVAVPVDRLYDAVVDVGRRDMGLLERTSTRAKTAHFDGPDGTSRVHVFFQAKDEQHSTVVVQHERLADAAQAEALRTAWRALAALRTELETEAGHA